VLLTKREKMKSRFRQISESNDASSRQVRLGEGVKEMLDLLYRKGEQKSRKLETCSSLVDN